MRAKPADTAIGDWGRAVPYLLQPLSLPSPGSKSTGQPPNASTHTRTSYNVACLQLFRISKETEQPGQRPPVALEHDPLLAYFRYQVALLPLAGAL